MNTSEPAESPSERELFFEALGKSSKEERSIFLDGACFNRPELRRRLEELLASHVQEDSFMKEAAFEDMVTLDDVPVSEGAGSAIGRYKLLQKVGEGGMGVVYMAEQTEPVTRKVALKIIKLGMDTKQIVARFEAERQALAMMDHPNIARVLDAGATETGRPYFVMELVRGVPITEYCDKNKLSTLDRLHLFIPVCQAIQHAHQKGVIHRDIKPSNVMVTLHDGNAVPKVIDFGIAKATNQKLTEKTLFTNYSQLIGTPAYMSPEQAEMSGLDVDTRTDVYSLGVLLYELLTGTTPFPSKELLSMGYGEMQKIITDKEPPKPSTRLSTMHHEERTVVAQKRSMDASALGKTFQGDLDWIVMKALEKDRTRRYETANGLVADIKRHLRNEPVSAAAPTFAYQFEKFYRRNKQYMRVVAAIAGFLVTAVVFSTYQAVRATRAEKDQTEQRDLAVKALEGESKQRIQAETEKQRAIESQRQFRRLLYVADMPLVQQAISEGNLSRASLLLDRHRPKAGEEDLRGFEWCYLWEQAQSSGERLGHFDGSIGGLAFSPDNVHLASSVPSGVEIRILPHRKVIKTLPYADVDQIQFSPDGSFLAVLSEDRLVFWNTSSWEEEFEISGLRAPFAFAKNGQVIVARDMDNNLSVWDSEKRNKLMTLSDAIQKVWISLAIAVSPDGNTVFIDDGGTIRSWDLVTETEQDPIRFPAGEWANSLTVSSNGLLAVAHWNLRVTLWDLKTRQLLHVFQDHMAWVSRVVFSPDGAFLATASADQNIFLYDTKSYDRVRRFNGHEGEIFALDISPDGRWMASGSQYDYSLMLWDVNHGSRGTQQVQMSVPLRFVDSNRSLICASDGHGFDRLDLESGNIYPMAETPSPLVLPNHELRSGTMISLSPNGMQAAVILLGGDHCEIWNTQTGERKKVLEESSQRLDRTMFSNDGKYLAVAGQNVPTRLYDTNDWSYTSLSESESWEVRDLMFSSNPTRLFQVNPRGVIVYHLTTRQLIFQREIQGAICGAISDDGRLLAVGTSSNKIFLWDLESPQEPSILRGHVSGVTSLSFSPDGKTLASGADSRVKLWNIETTQEILSFPRFDTESREVLFSPDGSCLAASSADNHVHYWRARSFEEIDTIERKRKASTETP